MSRELGTPDTVLAKARLAGAHNDCLLSAPTACTPCKGHVRAALDSIYGHLPSHLVISAIINDLRSEP